MSVLTKALDLIEGLSFENKRGMTFEEIKKNYSEQYIMALSQLQADHKKEIEGWRKAVEVGTKGWRTAVSAIEDSEKLIEAKNKTILALEQIMADSQDIGLLPNMIQQEKQISTLTAERDNEQERANYNYQNLCKAEKEIQILTAQPAELRQHHDEELTMAYDQISEMNIELAEARKAIELLIEFIPDGWSMPLGYMQVVAQAKEALAGKKEEKDEES
jgi:hypothetical protein